VANNFYILAAVGFTVGLVTDEIVRFLIKLTRSILRAAQKEEGYQDKTIKVFGYISAVWLSQDFVISLRMRAVQ
jgi:hypothetical protein